ncbi:hypothetical protein CEUSTIGMA_g10607.t1 [Chlamydomonas eustigma]|uniref:Protein kinase domain-containing protein n=1 Tax=Chlamydomonas eustigma TaxID=1157962 RepID=A0A250XJB6_9CHLO|nr:hypothetical protein CEUSTIGMA_g10607.t1 [Chlamydomonas eustigma]|eukprot:GAX83181.1 hypothetical protein CEUSTIGMA_g10607.t1 [Chlamydomonas eustigma]
MNIIRGIHNYNLKDEPLTGHLIYEKIVSLAKGPGSVFKQVARHRETGEIVTIKFIPRGWDAKTAIGHTRSLYNHMELSMANHPHIVEMKGAFLTPYYLALVMEYVEGETVEDFLEKVGGKIIEGLARFITQQLIIAVDFCHRKGKLLRDIKLSNILLSISEGQLPLVKLCDFTISKDLLRDVHEETQPETSALFAAPEVMKCAFGGQFDGKMADLWSCGIVLYIMLYGRHPFMRDQDVHLAPQQRLVAMMQRMLRNDVDFPSGCSLEPVSPNCLHLLSLILVADPNNRITMQHLKLHPWFMEALPEGAGSMNDLFLTDSVGLSLEQVAFFKALIKKASLNDGDCQLSTPEISQQLAVAAGAGSNQQLAAASGAGSRHHVHQPSTSQPTYNQPMYSTLLSAGTPYSEPLQPTQFDTSQHMEEVIGQQCSQTVLQPGGQEVNQAGFVESRNTEGFPWGLPQQPPGTSGNRIPSASLPTFLQRQLVQGGTLATAPGSNMDWVTDLEDSIMTIPSQDLLFAATEDIRNKAGRSQLLNGQLSLIAPRTMSEMERSLCASSSFMREAMRAGLTGLDHVDASSPSEAGESLSSKPSPGDMLGEIHTSTHIVDPTPFLATADNGLPMHVTLSSLAGDSFDWTSFNEVFAAEHGNVAASPPAKRKAGSPPGPAESAWAQVCRDVSIRYTSSGGLEARPPSWLAGPIKK